MPNTDAINGVIEAIKNEPRSFNMSMWASVDDDTPCGTVMCIAGHAIHNALSHNHWNDFVLEKGGLWSSFAHDVAEALGISDYYDTIDFIDIGAELFGLTYEVANVLFCPDPLSATPEQAITMLEWVRDFEGHLSSVAVAKKWADLLHPRSIIP